MQVTSFDSEIDCESEKKLFQMVNHGKVLLKTVKKMEHRIGFIPLLIQYLTPMREFRLK